MHAPHVGAADSCATYTVAQTAEILGLSRGATYALLRAGKIPSRRMGGRWIIPRHRLHTWLDETPTGGDL